MLNGRFYRRILLWTTRITVFKKNNVTIKMNISSQDTKDCIQLPVTVYTTLTAPGGARQSGS